MAIKSVGFLLKAEGRAQVVNDFQAVGAAGTAAMNDVAEAVEQTAARATAAIDRATERQIASWQRQATAAKVAAAGAAARVQVDAALSSSDDSRLTGNLAPLAGSRGAINFDRSSGAARTSAGAFQEYFDAEAAALKLKAAIDPLWAAEQQLARALEEVALAEKAGVLSSTELTAAQARAQAQFDRTKQAAAEAASSVRLGENADAQVRAYWQAQADQQERAQQAALKLRTVIDPLWAAEQQLARALEEVTLAEKAGVLSAGQLADARARAQLQFDRSKKAVDEARSNVRLGDSADAQVRAYWAEQAAEQDRAAQAAVKLKAAVDPLWAAEKKLEEQLREVTLAEKAGVLSANDLTEARARARREFEQSRKEIERGYGDRDNGGANNRDTLIYTASDTISSLSSGAGIGTIIGQQGPQVLQEFLTGEDNFKKLQAAITPLNVGLVALGAALITGAAAWYSYSEAMNRLNQVAEGSGRLIGMTGEELQAAAEKAADAGNITVAAAREIELGYVQAGKIGGEVLTGLTAITNDFAAATGTDTTAAVQTLAAAFADPIQGAQDLAEKYGLLDQKTIEYVQTLVEQNKVSQAQAVLLKAIQNGVDGTADKVSGLARAWRDAKNGASEFFTFVGKYLDLSADAGAFSLSTFGLMPGNPNFGKAKADTSKQDAQAKRNAALQVGGNIVEDFTGAGQLTEYNRRAGQLRAALAANPSAEQRGQLTEALDAYTRAIDSFIPKQEKANQLAAVDAKIAAAKTPAAKAALAADRERIELSGQVVTRAQVETAAQAAATRARAQGDKAGASHAATLAREAASMEVSAQAALDVADAYLKSSAAGVQAEARRKALTDATRRGIDADAQAVRQLALQAAEGAATGARSIAQLREETAARAAANDNVAEGKLAAAQLNQSLADESVLRPLIALQATAQGAAYEKLTEIIAAYRKALGEAHEEEGRSAALVATAALQARIDDARANAELAGDTSGVRERLAARRAAEREADQRRYSGEERENFISSSVGAVVADQSNQRAGAAASALKAERDRLALIQAELGLVGSTAQQHDRVIGALQLQQQLAAALGDEYDKFAPAILAQRAAVDDANAELSKQQAIMAEIRGFASDLLDPSGWEDWGDAANSVLAKLKGEFIKLALLNPLTNMLNGDSALPTIGGVIGKLTSLFGGRTASSAQASFTAGLRGNAVGTEYFPGGLTWVNENGPEIAELPSGTRIYPAAETRRMMNAANDGGGGVTVIVNAQDAVLADTVRQWVRQGVEEASIRGAHGGAQLARDRAAKQESRRIRR